MRVFDVDPLVSVLLDEPGAKKIAAALDADLTMSRVSAVTYSRVIERVGRDERPVAMRRLIAKPQVKLCGSVGRWD